MAASLDDLLARWNAHRDAASTLLLCDALRVEPRPDVLAQVGDHVREHMQSNVAVLLATARLYLEGGLLADAQTLLLAAGKAAPRDGAVYRWLGEVLLRRGDAERAEKVLERAVGFGANDARTLGWLDRARALRGTQSAKGTRAVAAEIARRYPLASVTAPEEDDGDTHAYRKASARPAPVVSRGPLPSPPAAAPPPIPAKPLGGHTAPLVRPRAAEHDPEGEAPTDVLPAVRPGSIPPPLPPSASVPPPRVASVPPPKVASAPPPKVASAPQKPTSAPPPAAAKKAPPPLAPAAPRASLALGGQEAGDLLDVNTVLDALAAAGVYEVDDAPRANLTWDAPRERPKVGKRLAVLLGSMAVFAGLSAGAFFFVKHQRDLQHQQAEQLLATVETNLSESRTDSFEPSERALSKAFDLESRSKRAALLWLRERAMRGLLLTGASELAFEESIRRAREVGVAEPQIAFAQVASPLFQGDLASAAAQVVKLDTLAHDEPYFQLLAGATFERAGDPRATERYAAALQLAPAWVLAEMLTTRANILAQTPNASAMAQAYREKHPADASAVALRALAWAFDPLRPVPGPAEVGEAVKLGAELPLPVQSIPSALRAMGAAEAGDQKVMESEAEKALASVDTPGMATWLGTLAASAGDEAFARHAALVALSYSAAYTPARALVARVALLGGRIDEGVKATEELDPSTIDVAQVRAASGYERCDLDLLARSLEAVPEATRGSGLLAGLLAGKDTLLGQGEADANKVLASHTFWADIIAMDMALDRGDLSVAERIAGGWSKEGGAAHRATRLSRLARYQGKADVAETESAKAVAGGATLRSLYERTLVLVGAKKFDEASALLAKNPAPLGPHAGWLSAYVVASSGKVDDARARTTSLEAPPDNAPYPVRLLALVSSAAMHDTKRGTSLMRPILKSKLINQDVRDAASGLHMPKL